MANKANRGELTEQERNIFDCISVWGGLAAMDEFNIGRHRAETIHKKGGGDGPLPLVDRKVMLEDDDRACYSLTEIFSKGVAYIERQNTKLVEQNVVLHDQLQEERRINKELRGLLRQGEYWAMTRLILWAKNIEEDGNGNGEPEESDIERFRRSAGMA